MINNNYYLSNNHNLKTNVLLYKSFIFFRKDKQYHFTLYNYYTTAIKL